MLQQRRIPQPFRMCCLVNTIDLIMSAQCNTGGIRIQSRVHLISLPVIRLSEHQVFKCPNKPYFTWSAIYSKSTSVRLKWLIIHNNECNDSFVEGLIKCALPEANYIAVIDNKLRLFSNTKDHYKIWNVVNNDLSRQHFLF